ncbi:MAG: hypothetical protein LAT66_12570 [Alkalimonas sp.]|nr:hypothetical protein [Alkalimonas sp.]
MQLFNPVPVFFSIGFAISLLVGCGSSDPEFDITVSSTGSGTVSPTTQQVKQGRNTQFTVTPAAGHQVIRVTGCGGQLTGTSYAISSVQGNCQVNAEFAPIMSVSVSNVPDVMDEQSSGTISLDISNPYGMVRLDVNALDGAEWVTIESSVQDKIISIEVAELFQEHSLTLSIVVGDDSPAQSVAKQVTIPLRNSSAQHRLEFLQYLATKFAFENIDPDNFNPATLAADKTLVAKRLYRVAQMGGFMSSSAYEALTQQTRIAMFDTNVDVLLNIEFIAKALERDYNEQTVDETELAETTSMLVKDLAVLVTPYRQKVELIANHLPEQMVPDISADTYYFTTNPARMSLYVGNPKFGQQTDDGWRFNDAYSFLSFLMD